MKKLLFFLLLSYSGFSQSNLITIDKVTPDTVCINEKVTVHLTFIYTAFSPTTTINILDSTSPSNTNSQVLIATYQQWIDSNYTMSFNSFANLVIGHNSLRTGFPSNRYDVLENNCTYAIEHYKSQADLLSTQYYNLLGQPIQEPDGLTIEVKNYVGGQREVRKIVTTK